MGRRTTRRTFIKIAAATAALGSTRLSAAPLVNGEVPRRPLGRTGVEVSILALGGAHLGVVQDEGDAIRIVQEAVDGGITFMDNAWEYANGRAEEIMGRGLKGRREKVFLMTKVCTHGRNADVAMQQLEDSLRRLGTDHLDLWQVHEVIRHDDPDLHYAEGGVLEALDRARQQGKVRFVGFTGHKHPDIHREMLRRGYAFDTVQMPLNVFDGTFRSFEKHVLPEVNRRGMGAIGMKSLGGAGDPVRRGLVTPQEAIRYVLSLPIAALVSGIDSLQVLRQNLEIARTFRPMSPQEMQALRDRVAREARSGELELFKTTRTYDGALGRQVRGD
ncbi:MAG: aldo/keto reductase [Myxococcota bacterium]